MHRFQHTSLQAGRGAVDHHHRVPVGRELLVELAQAAGLVDFEAGAAQVIGDLLTEFAFVVEKKDADHGAMLGRGSTRF